MLKRNLLLGGLVAGAFLLPSVAGAGVVTGPCVNCHTMHNSQNGAVMITGTAYGDPGNVQLLVGSGCTGCHTGSTNNASGVGGVANAPQVSDSTTNVLSGGYFAATDANMHNATGTLDTNFTVGVTPIPGQAGTYAQLTCQQCHTDAGHHNGTGTYRMTGYGSATAGDASYGAAGATFPGDRTLNNYGSPINAFCGGCHGAFHTQQGSAGAWVRHPTDVVMNRVGNPGSVVDAFTGNAVNPLGWDATNTNVVLCLSCHVAHGGPNPDLLSFDYTANVASATGGTQSVGCETCHSYGATGM